MIVPPFSFFFGSTSFSIGVTSAGISCDWLGVVVGTSGVSLKDGVYSGGEVRSCDFAVFEEGGPFFLSPMDLRVDSFKMWSMLPPARQRMVRWVLKNTSVTPSAGEKSGGGRFNARLCKRSVNDCIASTPIRSYILKIP